MIPDIILYIVLNNGTNFEFLKMPMDNMTHCHYNAYVLKDSIYPKAITICGTRNLKWIDDHGVEWTDVF